MEQQDPRRRISCHNPRLKVHAIQRWVDETLILDLFSLALALSTIGRRTLEVFRPDGSQIPMDGGHA
jgi:hypothetical protein